MAVEKGTELVVGFKRFGAVAQSELESAFAEDDVVDKGCGSAAGAIVTFDTRSVTPEEVVIDEIVVTGGCRVMHRAEELGLSNIMFEVMPVDEERVERRRKHGRRIVPTRFRATYHRVKPTVVDPAIRERRE